MTLSKKVIEDIKKHGEAEFPREACGLIIVKKGKRHYKPCNNLFPSSSNFAIDPVDYVKAEDEGEIVMVVHTHCNVSPEPSQADLSSCEKSDLPWLIMNIPTGNTVQFKPTGYQVPLIGREFSHGSMDCYTFIEDYYKQVLNIDLPAFPRDENWWLSGQDMYREGFEKAGFERVDTLQKHDVILMQVAAPVPNHGAIYIGDGKIEHHQSKRLSSRDVFGGWYEKIATHYLRHRDLV